MTLAKAKMYKTAEVGEDTVNFKKGDIVAVKFISRGAFGYNFRISIGPWNEVVSDSSLINFVL
jgi:hypothetical protein